MDTTLETGLVVLNTAYKKVAHKAVEATGEFIGYINANKTVKPKPVPDENSRNSEKIVEFSRQKKRNIEDKHYKM